jgi:hypothetical protein
LRHPQTGKNSTRAAVADGQPIFGSCGGNDHEDQNDTQYGADARFHIIALSIVPDHNAAPGQMPERLKQKTNDEFFEVKPLGEERLVEMKAARCGIARLLDWSPHCARTNIALNQR